MRLILDGDSVTVSASVLTTPSNLEGARWRDFMKEKATSTF